MARTVNIEERLFGILFGAVESIYLKRCVTPVSPPLYVSGTLDEAGDGARYCIGPVANCIIWLAWYDWCSNPGEIWVYTELTLLERDSKDYLIATAEKEFKWIELLGRCWGRIFRMILSFLACDSPGLYWSSQKYQSIAPYLQGGQTASTGYLSWLLQICAIPTATTSLRRHLYLSWSIQSQIHYWLETHRHHATGSSSWVP